MSNNGRDKDSVYEGSQPLDEGKTYKGSQPVEEGKSITGSGMVADDPKGPNFVEAPSMSTGDAPPPAEADK